MYLTTKEQSMSVITASAPVVLEAASQAFVEATAKPPFLYELTPIEKLPVEERWITVPAEVGDVRVRIVRPYDAVGTLPVGARAAVVFVEYDRSPEAKHPVAIEQAYATAQWITRSGAEKGLDATRLAVAGDSVGGNMTAVVAILAKERGDVSFVHQSLYYPVTDAAQDTDSYREFAEGPYLRAQSMAWFWDAYCPDPAMRRDITASPLRATLSDLAGLPEAFLIVDENDVLRDEGEAYARKLTAAGVRTTSVRYNGIIHDFMMLNPVRDTAAASAAVEQAVHELRRALKVVA
jgi:acetyl esterase/lipase